MKIGAIIPARYDSSRFPGKPLVKIAGISMIERVYNQVVKANKFSDIIVATDNEEIEKEVKSFGGKVVMTSKSCLSGTERIVEVLDKIGFDAVVNIQGDEPLISEYLISDVYDSLKNGNGEVVTAAFFNNSTEDFADINTVKVIVDSQNRAIYFSRSPIPYMKPSDFDGFFQHVGIYGYTEKALRLFLDLPQSDLEKKEKLEQLRFIDMGLEIVILKTDYRSVGVDIPEDVKKIEQILKDLN